MPLTAADRDRIARADAELVRLASDVKVLTNVGWPAGIRERFLAGWRAGRPRLPEPTYPAFALSGRRGELEALADGLDAEHPLEAHLAATARSYADVCGLLEAIGRPEFGARSLAIYGGPSDRIPGGRVAVVVDPALSAKAAAGATRIRLRGATSFSQYDVEQLLQHEAFVHSLTALNGRDQPLLRSLGLGAPRTTASQEGLATFAELVTASIDIARLERLARRVLLIDRVRSGADFVELFRWCLEQGQSEDDAYFATMRVFRGAPLTGGSAFTKDVVYLRGLLEVHTFFRSALRHGHLDAARHFLSGRMTPADAVRLRPFFESGALAVGALRAAVDAARRRPRRLPRVLAVRDTIRLEHVDPGAGD